jgi:hypothetical protein
MTVCILYNVMPLTCLEACDAAGHTYKAGGLGKYRFQKRPVEGAQV